MGVPNVKRHHLGRKVERIRELKGMKQETLASGLGVTQQAVSKLERSENIDDAKLEKIASLLGVTTDAIKNFNEDAPVHIIANTVNTHDQSALVFYNPIFNPIDALLELVNENKKLYERLLKEKDELISVLKKKTR